MTTSGGPTAAVLYEFEKSRATVRAYITEFHGKRYAHVREFFEPRDHPGTLLPTRAGISVEIEDLDELQACIDALRAAVSAPSPQKRSRRAA